MTRKLIKMSVPKLLVVLMFLSVFVFPFFAFEVSASSEDAAASAVGQAEEVLASAYEAVLGAEQARAEVTGLLASLNEAGELLAKAQVAFKLGDFDEAAVSAGLCSEICEGVRVEADELRGEAYGSRVMDSWSTMTGSLVGVVAVVFGSFWGWRVFKRRYVRRVSKMKPEVAKDGS